MGFNNQTHWASNRFSTQHLTDLCLLQRVKMRFWFLDQQERESA